MAFGWKLKNRLKKPPKQLNFPPFLNFGRKTPPRDKYNFKPWSLQLVLISGETFVAKKRGTGGVGDYRVLRKKFFFFFLIIENSKYHIFWEEVVIPLLLRLPLPCHPLKLTLFTMTFFFFFYRSCNRYFMHWETI